MAIRVYKPTSPARRFMSVLTFEEVTKTTPEKSLLESKKKNAGRNKQGKITVRHQGGGNKVKYRVIDFKRNKDGIPAKVAGIEYDPNRTAHIALLNYADGEKRHRDQRRGRGHQAGQRAADPQHPSGHADPQHRARSGPRRPARPQRRRRRSADGEGRRERAGSPPLRRSSHDLHGREGDHRHREQC